MPLFSCINFQAQVTLLLIRGARNIKFPVFSIQPLTSHYLYTQCDVRRSTSSITHIASFLSPKTTYHFKAPTFVSSQPCVCYACLTQAKYLPPTFHRLIDINSNVYIHTRCSANHHYILNFGPKSVFECIDNLKSSSWENAKVLMP
jgi:hypothetical protein